MDLNLGRKQIKKQTWFTSYLTGITQYVAVDDKKGILKKLHVGSLRAQF